MLLLWAEIIFVKYYISRITIVKGFVESSPDDGSISLEVTFVFVIIRFNNLNLIILQRRLNGQDRWRRDLISAQDIAVTQKCREKGVWPDG